MTKIGHFWLKLVIFGRKFAIFKVKWDNFGQKSHSRPFLPPLSFFRDFFVKKAIYRKPQQNVFSREITIFTKITKFQKCKKHAVIVKNRIRVSFIISGLISWVVLIQVLEFYRGRRLDWTMIIWISTKMVIFSKSTG